ncbi:MAG: SpoIIE family protein phosphatase, partial [Bacteroidia bacterium]
DDSLYFGDPYIEYNKTFMDNYSKGDVIEQYTDEFGTWLTAFTPILNDKGQAAGIIEVDMRFDDFIAEANIQLYRNLIISILIFIITTFVLLRYVKVILVTEEDSKSKLEELYKLIHEKNKEITDSINYAQRIQRSLLASDKILNDNMADYFIFFKPKDIVSGDFYWASMLNNNQFALVTADSTGHGVPGAIMSMLNISCLNEAIKGQKLSDPKEILNYTRMQVIEHLSNDGSVSGGKDGMDCSISSFDFKNKKLTYSAANNPLWIARNNPGVGFELLEFVADKMPVGKHERDTVSFNQKTIELQKDDVVYTLTDGYADQFGGVAGKKFKYKQLKELLLSIAGKPMNEQKESLLKRFEEWKGPHEQIDDVLLIGVKI